MKRESYQTEEYLKEEIEFTFETIEDFKKTQNEKVNKEDKRRLQYGIYKEYLRLIFLKYSSGYTIADISKSYLDLLKELEEYTKYDDPFDDFKTDLDRYIHALWLISFAILLNIDENILKNLVKIIDNEGSDLLYEKLITVRIPDRGKADKLLFPKQYTLLHEAIRENDTKKIEQFLDKYYKSMTTTHWHDSHKSDDSGFMGYWCFELAACVKAFNIDDSSFIDNMYYPKDIVHI